MWHNTPGDLHEKNQTITEHSFFLRCFEFCKMSEKKNLLKY